jgi:hypothetical protein
MRKSVDYPAIKKLIEHVKILERDVRILRSEGELLDSKVRSVGSRLDDLEGQVTTLSPSVAASRKRASRKKSA